MRHKLSVVGGVITVLIGIALGAVGAFDRLPTWSLWVGGALLILGIVFMMLAPNSAESKPKRRPAVSQNVSGVGIANVTQVGGDLNRPNDLNEGK